ncbi:hypothetical protein G4G28_17815 [Massilia sp. Dwa41.01b]|uniref:hypothetical protein n=1 Tax=unclassified Massilia TaxID=2609279 RepID=UPI00160064E1|nr:MULTISPECIES: hypothetical protein [unclassified Massilia]QNA89886.1 hypothetical protein G4G28_17815 [Massilia sp. Dwa41.01b]QNB00772.1 hypothetical protein G4G31_21375 [Massilia sp. Se16.2.3]
MSPSKQALLGCMCVLLLSGCRTVREGGAPEPSFDLEADLRMLDQEFRSTASIKDYYSIGDPAQKVTARNRFVMGRIAQIDLRYIAFIRGLTADRQKLDAATDLASLSINLAGTLVGGVRSGKNLAAAAAAIGGAKQTIVKDFYYDKSLDALVGTMNAQRKAVLVGILQGLKTPSVEQYPFELALTQLHDYYMAGTINGALRFINSASAEQEKSSDAAIERLAVLPASSQKIYESVTRLGGAVRAAGAKDAAALDGALLSFGIPSRELEGLDLEAKKLRLLGRLDAIISDPKTATGAKEAALGQLIDKFTESGLLK